MSDETTAYEQYRVPLYVKKIMRMADKVYPQDVTERPRPIAFYMSDGTLHTKTLQEPLTEEDIPVLLGMLRRALRSPDAIGWIGVYETMVSDQPLESIPEDIRRDQEKCYAFLESHGNATRTQMLMLHVQNPDTAWVCFRTFRGMRSGWAVREVNKQDASDMPFPDFFKID